MIRLSKKSEYALIALQYIAINTGRLVSAKEIAEHYGISFEFVAKTLQILMKNKLVVSQQGATGGYALLRLPQEISIAQVIEAIEGKSQIVECCGESGGDSCSMHGRCTIKTPMGILQRRIDEVLSSITVHQLAFPHMERYYTVQSILPNGNGVANLNMTN
ncbi:MAG: Rrf2 family transcriptional regulator [Candidatus Kapabacteria bacterium]|jgi:Rrf2 family protein|nr:Rrf2 family transcriptional regulator [Candidatus Kapabacteria bacterium]